MSETEKDSPIPLPGSVSFYYLTAFFVTVGILYLWGYWSTFGINILEYLSIGDVIRLTAYPIASSFVFSLVGMLLGEFTWGANVRKALPPGAGVNTPVGRFLNKHVKIIVTAYYCLIAVVAIIGNQLKWGLLPVLIAIPIARVANNRDFLVKQIPDSGLRKIAAFALVLLPMFSFGRGKVEAQNVQSGKLFNYVISHIEQVETPANAKDVERIRFIGHAGDYFFVLEPRETVLIISKIKDDRPLLLKHFDQSP